MVLSVFFSANVGLIQMVARLRSNTGLDIHSTSFPRTSTSYRYNVRCKPVVNQCGDVDRLQGLTL